jgi:predicted GH43/DUF377 family glycosyl hydrolase
MKWAMVASAVFCLSVGVRAQTLDDVWRGKARFEIEKGDDGKARTFGFQGMHFGSFVDTGKGWNCYYIDHSMFQNCVGLATTTDGVHFEKYGVVLWKGVGKEFDSRIASFPGVYKDGNRWYMVYEAADGLESDWRTWRNRGSVGLAVSDDGIHWTKKGELLAKKEPWESQNIGTPSLLLVKGIWWVFYHGFGPSGAGGSDDVQIGAARGSSLTPRDLRRVSNQPLVPTSVDPAAFDSGTVGRRSIIKEGAWWYMAYEACTDQAGSPLGFNHSKWTSGLARSRDLVHWEKLGRPMLPQLNEFGNDGPEFLQTRDGRLHIYFRLPGNWTGRATLVGM